MKIKISDIRIAGRKRKASPHKVRELADSINRLGLLNPVTISSKKELIAGLHRLGAHKLLGLSHIEAHIKDFNDFKKELAEIDENLIRNEPAVLPVESELRDPMGYLPSCHHKDKPSWDRA